VLLKPLSKGEWCGHMLLSSRRPIVRCARRLLLTHLQRRQLFGEWWWWRLADTPPSATTDNAAHCSTCAIDGNMLRCHRIRPAVCWLASPRLLHHRVVHSVDGRQLQEYV
jgi:hypothetical protein